MPKLSQMLKFTNALRPCAVTKGFLWVVILDCLDNKKKHFQQQQYKTARLWLLSSYTVLRAFTICIILGLGISEYQTTSPSCFSVLLLTSWLLK